MWWWRHVLPLHCHISACVPTECCCLLLCKLPGAFVSRCSTLPNPSALPTSAPFSCPTSPLQLLPQTVPITASSAYPSPVPVDFPLLLLIFHPCSCYRDRLVKEPPPDEATQAQLADVLGWLSKALQLLSLLLQHGGQMEAFLDDGGVMSLCLHLSKYPVIHANLPPRCDLALRRRRRQLVLRLALLLLLLSVRLAPCLLRPPLTGAVHSSCCSSSAAAYHLQPSAACPADHLARLMPLSADCPPACVLLPRAATLRTLWTAKSSS